MTVPAGGAPLKSEEAGRSFSVSSVMTRFSFGAVFLRSLALRAASATDCEESSCDCAKESAGAAKVAINATADPSAKFLTREFIGVFMAFLSLDSNCRIRPAQRDVQSPGRTAPSTRHCMDVW